jgi:uncharacterized phage protein gp47/JayE
LAGITEYGFQRKILQEILTSMKTNVRNKLGEDWNIATGSIEDQFISTFAEEADQCWQGLEGVVSSGTLDGAEGIYLDDILSRQGVYRKGKTASSGRATLFSSYATTNLGVTIPTTSTVGATNGLVYNVVESRVIDNFMSCYKLSTAQLTVGTTYNITIYNANAASDRVFTFTVTTESSKDTMLINFAEFVNEVVLDKPSNAFFDAATRTAYVGFNPFTKLPQPFVAGTLFVQSTPRVGSFGHTLELRSPQLGFNPLSADSLTNLSPSYTGYESVVNGDDFNAGSEVQTDTEYRLSALNIKETSIAGTVDSIISGLLRIDGVVDAAVFENPTQDTIYDVSDKIVCQPFTYNVVVLGGDDNKVAQVILDKSPANTKRYGTYSAMATNSKGQSVNVNFTRCGYFDVGVEVKYRTKDGSPLTETEKANVIENLGLASSELTIGDIVVPSALQAVVFQSVSFTRLKSVEILIRDLTLPSSGFTTLELTADSDEKPRILADQVQFLRV